MQRERNISNINTDNFVVTLEEKTLLDTWRGSYPPHKYIYHDSRCTCARKCALNVFIPQQTSRLKGCTSLAAVHRWLIHQAQTHPVPDRCFKQHHFKSAVNSLQQKCITDHGEDAFTWIFSRRFLSESGVTRTKCSGGCVSRWGIQTQCSEMDEALQITWATVRRSLLYLFFKYNLYVLIENRAIDSSHCHQAC